MYAYQNKIEVNGCLNSLDVYRCTIMFYEKEALEEPKRSESNLCGKFLSSHNKKFVNKIFF